MIKEPFSKETHFSRIMQKKKKARIMQKVANSISFNKGNSL